MINRIVKNLCVVLAIIMTVFSLASCGKSGFSPDKNISVVTREDGSGTKSAFMEIIGLKGKADREGVIVASSTASVLAEVKGNPLAIAYESLGYVTDDVKMLKIDGVAPTVENIKNGTYKISRPLNIVYKPETISDGAEKAFYEFLQSSDAQRIISDNGYVSTKDNATEYTIKSGLSGTITVSGSTSLQPLMVKLAAKFEEMQSGITVSVSGGGSGTGYKNAAEGVSDFGMISENFNQSKATGCTYYEVAKDGIAIIVNKQNTNDNISLQTLKNIYDAESSDCVKWSDAE